RRDVFTERWGNKRAFPNCWKGDNGLYAVEFTKRGLMGASMEAKRIAQDFEICWKSEAKQLSAAL
ncbi:indole-3-pyruvate monooxygenase YUCCA6-like, partial [Olea europaea subsp. europaea]